MLCRIRAATIAAATVSLVASYPTMIQAEAAEQTVMIPYLLHKSEIKIDAALRQRLDADGTPVREVSTATFSLITQGDAGAVRLLDPSMAIAANVKTITSFTNDGRLASLDTTSTGQGGAIIKALFRGMTTVLGVTGAGQPFAQEDANKLLEAYEKEYPDRAARRGAYRRAEGMLIDKLATLGEQVASSGDAQVIERSLKDVNGVEDVLARLRKEMILFDNHFASWKAMKQQTVEIQKSLVASLSTLPQYDEVVTLMDRNPSETALDNVLGDYAPVFDQTLFIVAIKDVIPKMPEIEERARRKLETEAHQSLHYRAARPVMLCLFKTGSGASKYKPILEACRVEGVVDERSPIVTLPIKSRAFGKQQLIANFGENGTLNTITNDRESGFADFAKAFSEMPTELLTGLQQANQILDANRELNLQALDDRIEEVKKQKTVLEEEIALQEKLAAVDADAELSDLQRQLALLQAQKSLATATAASQSNALVADLQMQQQVIELQSALQRAELERLKIQAEMARLREQVENESP